MTFPLPFGVRIDMTALGMRMAGSMDGKQYRLRTDRAVVETGREPAGANSDIFTIQQRLKWRTVLRPRAGELWVATIEADRDDFTSSADASDNELAIAFVEFAMRVLNRYLRAYSIATEDSAVRPLTPEAFDASVAVLEFVGGRESESIERRTFMLPAATRDDAADPMEQRMLLMRLQHGLNSVAHDHPMDDVILWRLRAEHHINYVGDYELAVIALQTAMERRVFVIRSLLMIDEGADSQEVEAVNLQSYKVGVQ